MCNVSVYYAWSGDVGADRTDVSTSSVTVSDHNHSPFAICHVLKNCGAFQPGYYIALCFKEGLYRIQILCRRHPFWSYPAGLTIADPPQWRIQNILWGGAFHKYAEHFCGRVLNIGVAYNELNECDRISHGPLCRF